MKKPVKILLWIAGIVVAVLLLVSLVAGPVAKGYVNRHGEQLVGRHVQVGNVGVNLFTGHVYIRGLEVAEDDGVTPFAGFDTLDVRLHLLQLPFQTLNLRHITLSGLHANILQEGDRFNFSSLIEHFASDKDTTDTTSSSWTLKFYNIRLSHARLRYKDLQSNKGISLPDVNLRVPGFVLGGKEATEGGLNLSFDKGGHLNATANYDADKRQYTAKVALTDFALRNVEEYVQDVIQLDEMTGSLEATVTATGSTTALLNSHIGATATLHDVDLQESHGQLAALKELSVKVNNINLEQNYFDLAEVHLDGLTATYEQWDGYSNISRLIIADTAEVEEETKEEEAVEVDEADNAEKKPLQLHVGALLVENCSMTYIDHTCPDEFRFPVTNISIKGTNLSLNGDNNAQLRASLPGGGMLAARWQGNINQWKRHQDLFLTIKGLNLKQLSPLTVAYTSYPVEDGIFGLTSHTSIIASQLDGQNTIDIYNPVVGKKRKGIEEAKNIPLKTALYVLKDKDNKIQLDVPVKGNINSPEFNYMKLVWKTLSNLLVKVATSPARALGNVLGMGGEDLEFIAVDPQQHGLTSEQYHTLGQLASIVQSDSLLVLKLEQRMPEAANDTVARMYEMRNEQVRRYLAEQGVNESHINVVTGAPVKKKERTGYAVSSSINIEE